MLPSTAIASVVDPPLNVAPVTVKLTDRGAGSSLATVAVTGVEMEALTAASVAALTVYDMTKGLDKAIVIRNVQLESKTGGKSGEYRREGGRV